MNVYIWERIGNVTKNYHDGGGLLVIAKSITRAREIIKKKVSKKCEALTIMPDIYYSIKAKEQVIIFPDSGCCG